MRTWRTNIEDLPEIELDGTISAGTIICITEEIDASTGASIDRFFKVEHFYLVDLGKIKLTPWNPVYGRPVYKEE